MPEVIVVGVGAPVQNFDEWDLVRLRDYCIRPVAGYETSGHADAFLRALHDDVLPFVDSTYRSDSSDRTLWGHSFGGAFALHVLLKESTLFQRYIATSPAVVFDAQPMVDLGADAPAAERSFSASGVSVGMLDDDYRPHILAFTAALRSKNYEGLSVDFAELAGCGHASAAPPGFLAGLQSAFPGPG